MLGTAGSVTPRPAIRLGAAAKPYSPRLALTISLNRNERRLNMRKKYHRGVKPAIAGGYVFPVPKQKGIKCPGS